VGSVVIVNDDGTMQPDVVCSVVLDDMHMKQGEAEKRLLTEVHLLLIITF
jgi:hypothetical protein